MTLPDAKLGMTKEVMANKVLPFLIPLSIENGLTVSQVGAERPFSKRKFCFQIAANLVRRSISDDAAELGPLRYVTYVHPYIVELQC
jgi:hypothetical protein